MLKKILDNINFDKNINSYIICGDSGCDGYNTESVLILKNIMSADVDFALIAGDIVATGAEQYYEEFIKLVNSVSKTDVYCAVGNHDIENYEKYAGLKNYYISAPNLLLIILDNSRRYFSEETIFFLKDTLENNLSENISIVFHIPPQNPFIENNISNDEWSKIKKICDTFKSKINFIFCGHVHSAFDYKLDGYRIIVTGGAGSQLDPIDNTCIKINNYHYFKISFIDGKWKPELIEVNINELNCCGAENNLFVPSNRIYNSLIEAFSGEAAAYRKYKIFAETAEKQGFPHISNLFQAAAESEYIHAQLMFSAAGANKTTLHNLNDSIKRELEEVEDIYPNGQKISAEDSAPQAEISFKSALEAEKAHLRQFKKAVEAVSQGKDIDAEQYHICSRCGYMHTGDKPPKRCPGCGADMFKFKMRI